MPVHAHTHPDFPNDTSKWEPLFTAFGVGADKCQREHCQDCLNLNPYHGHLNKVAFWAARFAAEMFSPGSAEAKSAWDWGYLAGLWHDLGKFAPEWQTYLRSKTEIESDEASGKEDHSTAGAQHSDKRLPIFGRILAYLIAGHHAGLANGIDDSLSSLQNRLIKSIRSTSSAPVEILNYSNALPPPIFALSTGHGLSFFTRMLFSALVDADFLATEAFMSPERALYRPTKQPSILELEASLTNSLAKFGAPTTAVNRLRTEVLTACLEKAELPPGLFSLTVPTGGGKTLSSLAFALKHARIHNLRRIIYVIPYTSIIEQNAEVFRSVLAGLGPDVVVEHHSNLDPDSAHSSTSSRLASENWDARLIVTTNVQFFESLHAHRGSKCRKLHRIARSVVILDEAQSLPLEYLQTCMRSLEELTSHYHASVVLCTATQPAINKRENFSIGLPSPTEILNDPTSVYQRLQRVTATQLGTVPDEQLLPRILTHDQVLCIVGTRKHARQLYNLLSEDMCNFHLSALMCPEHRTQKFNQIKSRLKANLPVRLISTQLIEAGVDIDFPVVFRSLAGLDSIAQAAGRCDREGIRTDAAGHPAGQLFIFSPPGLPPAGYLRNTAASAAEVIASHPANLLGLDAIEAYFQAHYWQHESQTDQHHILECWPDTKKMQSPEELLLFQFKTCSENFKLIDDYSEPVIIPYGSAGSALCDEVRRTFDPARLRHLARKLQRYTVAIPRAQHERLLYKGIIQMIHDRFPILNSTVHYSDQYGLHPEPELNIPIEQSIL